MACETKGGIVTCEFVGRLLLDESDLGTEKFSALITILT